MRCVDFVKTTTAVIGLFNTDFYDFMKSEQQYELIVRLHLRRKNIRQYAISGI